jgi:hypothetical protein
MPPTGMCLTVDEVHFFFSLLSCKQHEYFLNSLTICLPCTRQADSCHRHWQYPCHVLHKIIQILLSLVDIHEFYIQVTIISRSFYNHYIKFHQ